jgi:hypothetical protein
MSDSDLKAILLFFFYVTLDEKKTAKLASVALKICNKKISANPKLETAPLIVAVTDQVLTQFKKQIVKGRPLYSLETGWRPPEATDLGPWKEFQREATWEELSAIVWSKIVGFSDEQISEGVGLTVGTLRYRIARALRRLGSLCRVTENSLSIARTHE